MTVSRRDFLATAIAGSLSLGLTKNAAAEENPRPQATASSSKRPILVCAHNGYNYLDDA